MDTKNVTILIIGNDDENVKSFKINRNLINNFKKYLLYYSGAIVVSFVVILSVIAYTLQISLDKQGLVSQLLTAKDKLEIYDSLKLNQKLNTIDNNLSMIDGYLQSRGVIETGNAGGVSNIDKQESVSHIEKIDYFEKQSIVFYNTLREIPIGYPYGGNRSSDYGYRRNPFGGLSGEFHPGVDFKGETGDPVYATGDGVINRCDWYNGYGNAVVIDHKSGYQSLFGHLSRVNVVQGQEVKAGDLVGFIGSTGRSTGPHLHYEIRQNGDDISPEPFLKVY
ncbi:MAG: M23 family metallopeptidase [Ignavibacteria bacterium]|nr:M23 family metallopeptidase [Ignavibacteria bacterium]